MAATHRQEVEAILAGAHAEHAALLDQVSPALRASLPVDATGLTQAIDHLAGVVGLFDDLRSEQTRGHRANPAVLHGRVFGWAPLSRGTVLAAFVEGARVREEALRRLAREVGGEALEDDVGAVLRDAAPELDVDADREAADAALRQTYAAQEWVAVRIAARLDGEA